MTTATLQERPGVLAPSETMMTLGMRAVIAAELILVLAVFHVFHLESLSGLLKLTPLIVVGFVLHSSLPMQYRAAFFVTLSCVALWMLLGVNSLYVIGIGGALIAVCHLPVGLWIRAAIISGIGALVVFKGHTFPVSGVSTFRWVPILASMFMFRTIIYLYDLRHERAPVSPWMRIAYFFLLPNACFTLFPIVDFQAFKRNYFDRESSEIYQRGVRLIFRGATHLIAYRFVYYYMSPVPDEIDGLKRVLLFLVSSWMIFLHVSGVFHLVIGILCMFGFNLPDANRLYFLASSPNEVWRRANIYWKDFMVKIFYLPSYKALQKRKIDMTRAMMISTVVVFTATWLLHSYQWFGITGKFPFAPIDAEFWGVFAALVLVNTLMELRKPKRNRTTGPKSWSVNEAATHTLKVMATFSMMCVMWSWWSTRDTEEWYYMVATVKESRPLLFLAFAVFLAVVFLLGVIAHYFAHRGWNFGIGSPTVPIGRSMALTSLGAAALLGIGQPEVYSRLGERPKFVVRNLESDKLNERDVVMQERSYYETIISVGQPTTLLNKDQLLPRGIFAAFRRSGATRERNDYMVFDLTPSKASMHRGVEIRTNSWGMRDKEYALVKPPGTYRMALLGGSVIMGTGVAKENVFETLIENRLNAEDPSQRYDHYEILNFSVAAHGLLQYMLMNEERAVKFHPDVVVLATFAAEDPRTRNELGEAIFRRAALPPFVADLVRRAGITRASRLAEINRKLSAQPLPRQLRRWTYQQIARTCRENGILPVWVYMPALSRKERPRDFDTMSEDARDAGMVTLDARGAYPEDRTAIRFDPYDGHPNALGHKLLAEKLYAVLMEHADEIRLGPLASKKH